MFTLYRKKDVDVHLLFFMTHMFLVPTGEAGMWPVSIKKIVILTENDWKNVIVNLTFLQTNISF